MKLKIALLLLLCPLTMYPQDVPLSDIDKREIWVYLKELKFARREIEAQQRYIDQDKEQDTREKELDRKALENEIKARQLAEQERDMWKAQADEYKSAYQLLANKKRSTGCIIKKIFTFGLARCQ